MSAPTNVMEVHSVYFETEGLSSDTTSSSRETSITGEKEVLDQSIDSELIAQLKVGNGNAINFLLNRYGLIVRSICRRILQDDAEAQDMTQEVFLQVFFRKETYDIERGSVRAWIVQIAYHRAIDRRRYLQSRNFYQNSPLDAAEQSSYSTNHPGSGSGSPLQDRFGAKVVEQLKQSLTAPQIETLEQYFTYGYSLEEIASRMNQSVGNVRNHYYRGLEKLRKGLLAAEGTTK